MQDYIYQSEQWPNFTWNDKELIVILGKVRHLQGKILGQVESLGFTMKNETVLSTLTLDVIRSSEIEGEKLNADQVRSSIARRLGIEYAGMVHATRDVEGVVEMMLDATQNYEEMLTAERLCAWHSTLFPAGRSGMLKIETGKYRTREMQIVSGPMGRESVHYEAPAPSVVEAFMDDFLAWFNTNENLDAVLMAAIAHFWFIIIHPFDDGNGRIARALSDLLLARSESSSLRCYSLSNQLLISRKDYYRILQKTQHSSGEITEWIVWFLERLYEALLDSEKTLQNVFFKTEFWDKHQDTQLNSRQRVMLNKLIDGFTGKLKTSKWAKITKCSPDTALRDIKDLIEKGILTQDKSGGRSTNYELVR